MKPTALIVAAWLAIGAFDVDAATKDEGLSQWRRIESVLTHPRCMNCHTGTGYPRQADDRHPHLFNVVRGPADRGASGAPCAMCHHETSAQFTGVPGAKGWRLAPLAMSWERAPGVRKTSRELCRVLTDPKRNGHRDAAQLIEHHADEPLVLGAWSPGRDVDGHARTTPPLTHAEFVDATRAWAAAGAPCPQ